MKKIVAYLLLLTLSAMLLVDCGGNDIPKTEETSAEETTEKKAEEVEPEKEIVEGIGIQTIDGKNYEVDFTITYDGDVLHLENEEDLADTNNVIFTSLEDKLKIGVSTDEKNFAGDNTLNRIYTEEVETLERQYTHEDGTVEIYTYPEYVFTEPVDKTIGSIAGKYFDAAITDSRGESFTRHYFMFEYDEYHYSIVYFDSTTEEQASKFEELTAAALMEITCGNITFYTFTMTYTDNQNNAVTSPLYFAEIEPGVYIYTNLGDTMQFGEVNVEKLAADEEMLKETFINVDIL